MKDAPSPPPAPNYQAAAQQTGADTLANLRAATQANRPAHQYTPLGSMEWWQPTGNPDVWNSQINLAPNVQNALDASLGQSAQLGQIGSQALPRVSTSMASGFDVSGVPGLVPNVQTPNLQTAVSGIGYGNPRSALDLSGVASMPVNAGTTGQQAIMSRLQPQIERERSLLETQLRNQGLVPGGEAYNQAMRIQNQRENDLLSQATLHGIGLDLSANQQGFGQALAGGQFGNTAQQQAYNQALASGQFANTALGQQFGYGMQNAALQNQVGQEAIQRQAYLRSLPLNELNALRTGAQVNMPTFQPGGQQGVAPGANYLGAAGQQATYNQGLYGLGVGQYNQGLSTLGTLGAAAMGLPWGTILASDRRLKSNVVRIGTHRLGVGIYEYDIFGERQRGVMADEILMVCPEAVFFHPGGFLMVDYGRL